MARPLRIEYPGAYYRVNNRGNAGETIFTSDRDHEKFLEYLATLHERFSVKIHSYCLMSNHYHLLIETPQANLSAAIQWLNVSYAAWFNKNRKRQGHLFQGRFKAVLVDADDYLAQVSRYIHLNPVKAGITAAPQDYRWSSYSDFIKERTPPEWLDCSLLTFFGSQRKSAVKKYRDFVEVVDTLNLENPNSLSLAGGIIGDTDFVDWVQEMFLNDKSNLKEIPESRKLNPAIAVDTIVDRVAGENGVAQELIRSKGKKRNQLREIAVYLSRRLSNLSGVELGRYFGGVSGAAISAGCRRFEKKMELDAKLRKRVEQLQSQIVNFKM